MMATDVLNLRVGDVVRLGSSTDAPLTLYAEEQPTHLVKVGKSGRKIAVEVIESVLVAKNWNYSTDGGR
jgi:flagellar motor switch protein FliM